MKRNPDLNRLLAMGLCAIAARVEASPMVLPHSLAYGDSPKGKNGWKPVLIPARKPVAAQTPPTLSSSGVTLDLTTGSGGIGNYDWWNPPANVGVGNSPIPVNNPPVIIGGPTIVLSDPILVNPVGNPFLPPTATGTLRLPGVKPKPISVISPVTGLIIGQQLPPPIRHPLPSPLPLPLPLPPPTVDTGGLGVSGTGTLDLGTSGGVITVTPGSGTLNVSGSPGSSSGGTLSLDNGSMGGGLINMSGGVINTNGWVSMPSQNVSETVTINGGTLTLSPGATIETDIAGASLIKIGTRTITLNYVSGTIFNSEGVELFGPGIIPATTGGGDPSSFSDYAGVVAGLTGSEVLLKYANGGSDSVATLPSDDFSLFLQGSAGIGGSPTNANFSAAVVPEPASLVWLSVGAVAIGIRRRRR